MRIIVGVSGASGVIMALRLLEALKAANCETHLVMTRSAIDTWKQETSLPVSKIEETADILYDSCDMSAAISSGSYSTDGMVILPCSMKTLAGIVSGYTDNLVLRAADVCLKENRKLILCPREMPLGKIHLRNMYEASVLGCTVIPPMLTFYQNPETVSDMIDHVIGKIMLQFGLHMPEFKVWGS